MSAPASLIAVLLASAHASPGAEPPDAFLPYVRATEAAAEAAPDALQPAAAGTSQAAPAAIPAQPGAAAPSTPPAASGEAEPAPIVVVGELRPPKSDPFEHINEKSFQAIQSVDHAVVAPIAVGYKNAVPDPVRQGLHNFFLNLDEPVVFVNFLLQFKPGKAIETVGRFAINSTLGLVGLVDVAKRHPFKLPYRPNSFEDTLGYYGVKPGAYLYLPLIGPTTVRDLAGRMADRLLVPLAVGKPFRSPAYVFTSSALKTLDERVRFDRQLEEFRAADNPYAAEREFYLAQRQAEIDALHGRKPPAPAPASNGKPGEAGGATPAPR